MEKLYKKGLVNRSKESGKNYEIKKELLTYVAKEIEEWLRLVDVHFMISN